MMKDGKISRWAIGAWLAGLLLGCVAAGAEETRAPAIGIGKPAPCRAPEIRHLDRKKDGADLKRIWNWRKKLPEQFYRRNNFGWAWAEIDGLDKKEYFAHSGIQGLSGFSRQVSKRLKDMSFSPEKGTGRFETLFVDYLGNVDGPNALPRWFDTEYKMLEDIAARLPDSSVSGTIRLYTNLEPCPSCLGVMNQFLAIYTNVEMVVFYEWP